MTQTTAKVPSGCLWILIAFAVLIGIVVSCHPSSTTTTPTVSSFEEPTFPYTAFDKPRTYGLAKASHGSRVNLRSGPSPDYAIVGTLPKNHTIVALGNATGSEASHWLVLRTDEGHIAYAKCSLLGRRDQIGNTVKTAALRPAGADCDASDGEVARTICQDPVLTRSDRTMAGLYGPLMSRLTGDDRTNLIQEQAQWVTERDQCASESNPKGCLSQQYQARILTLQLIAQQAEGSSNGNTSVGERSSSL